MTNNVCPRCNRNETKETLYMCMGSKKLYICLACVNVLNSRGNKILFNILSESERKRNNGKDLEMNVEILFEKYGQ